LLGITFDVFPVWVSHIDVLHAWEISF
jgi:hypothetical protein